MPTRPAAANQVFPLVKICGLTSREDALWAAECGADMLGFIFAPSPRRISLDMAQTIARDLPSAVQKVGVFVNASESELGEAMDGCDLDRIQLHGSISPRVLARFADKAIVAIRLGKDASMDSIVAHMEELTEDGVPLFLVDSQIPGMWGGTGQRADWGLARQLAERFPIVLAGGLSLENVAEAIVQVRPRGVDVSSGVEISPGVKDRIKMASFIAAVREAKYAPSR